MHPTFAARFSAWIKIILKYIEGTLVPRVGFRRMIIQRSSRFMGKKNIEPKTTKPQVPGCTLNNSIPSL